MDQSQTQSWSGCGEIGTKMSSCASVVGAFPQLHLMVHACVVHGVHGVHGENHGHGVVLMMSAGRMTWSTWTPSSSRPWMGSTAWLVGWLDM